MAKKRAIEIQADRVNKTACPKCGNVVDGSSVPPFSTLQCGKCQVRFASPGRLGGFILLKELGRGQMGVTYKAFEKMLGRYVAIKVMRATLGGDPKRVKEFMAEGRALASLDHPNAVRIYSIGQEKGQPYIAMELVNGQSVGHHMGPNKSLPEARALEIATGVARALKAATEMGLIHSDVKPDNIVLDEKGRAKLVDFGIARFGPGKLEADAAIGTPYYVAPEQVQRGLVDHRTDIYSLGATLYHMIAGKPPFPGTDLQTVLNARLKKSAPSLIKSCRGLHMETVHVVAKMLQRDPDRRYQNYDDLLKDLRRACWASGAELTQEADDIPISLATKGHSSSFAKAALVLVVVLAAAGVGAWAMFFRDKGSSGGGPDTPGPTDVAQVATPVFSPKARKIAGPTRINASCDTPKAVIHYTNNGDEPTRKSMRWDRSIKVEPGTTLRARAFLADMKDSEMVEAVYDRDSVVLKDVVGLRHNAKSALAAANRIDKGQTLGAEFSKCNRQFEQAEELYEKNAYAAAKNLYDQVIFISKRMKTLDSTRNSARKAQQKCDAAIALIPDFSAAAWKPVSDMSNSAKAVFQRGDFLKAYGLWGDVVKRIDERYKSMLPNVRKSYQRALAAGDPELLKKHAGNEFRIVESTAKQADEAAKAGRFGQAVALYKRAENFVGSAVKTAKAASQGAELDASIKYVADLIAKGHYYKAQSALVPLLKTAGNNQRLVNFKKAVDDSLEIKIPLQPGAKEERGGLVMKLSLVTPGKFQMGSPKEESGRDGNETLHEVEITKPYYIGQCEVSRRQFEHFLKATKYKPSAERDKKLPGIVKLKNRLARATGKTWRDPGFAQGGDHPVVCVTWEDANEFCKWMTKRAGGLTISLPTEAQWEYACRQGQQTRFSFGDDATKLCQYGNYADGTSGFAVGAVRNSDGKGDTAPVRSYKLVKSPPRVYDMHGNAAEWCSDYYGAYPRGSGGAAKSLVDPTGVRSGIMRVVRGGSWASSPAKCRSARRDRGAVKYSALVGFRVVASGKLPTSAQLDAAVKSAAAADSNWKPLTGRVGVGSWETKVQYRDLIVRRDNKEILRWRNPNRQKKTGHGRWWFVGSAVEQRELGRGHFVTFGETNWTDYTVSVKAKKTGGKEGFRVIVAHDGKNSGRDKYYLFNVGGKNNTKHGIEMHLPGKNPQYVKEVNGKIEQGKSYDIRVELAGRNIRCFLNNKLECEYQASAK
jgi:serine/threonine protein kinase/formylglycine-generating enzyme required for sulfatase activity